MISTVEYYFITMASKFTEPTSCGNCIQPISPNKSRAVCANCKNHLHLNGKCSGLKESSWIGKGRSGQKSWVCSDCKVNYGLRSGSTSTERENSSRNRNLSGSSNTDDQHHELPVTMENIITALKPIQNEIKEFRFDVTKEISTLKKNVVQLNTEVDKLQLELEGVKAYLCRNDLIISGVPIPRDEYRKPLQTAFRIAEKLQIPLEKKDIDACHILPAKNPRNSDLFIIRFVSRITKQEFASAARAKRPNQSIFGGDPGIPVFFNDHMTKSQRDLFKKTKLKTKDYSNIRVQTFGGKVYLKEVTPGANTGTEKRYRVDSLEKLEKLLSASSQ